MIRLARRYPGSAVTLGALVLFALGLGGAVAATGWAETGAALARLGPGELAALLALSLVNYGLRAVRWHLLARTAGVPTGFGRNLLHYLGGFAMTATPGRVGELVRLRWVVRETGLSLDRVAPMALADRAAELAAVVPLLAVAVVLSAVGTDLAVPVILVAAALAWAVMDPRLLRWGVTLAYRTTGLWPRLFARLRRVTRGLGAFLRPGTALPAVALGLLGWFAEAVAFGLLLDWLGAPVGLWPAAAIFLLAMLSGALAGLPGGLGGVEAAMVGLLALQGVPLSVALPATAIIRVTTLWFAIAIGLAVFPLAEARARRVAEARA